MELFWRAGDYFNAWSQGHAITLLARALALGTREVGQGSVDNLGETHSHTFLYNI
jgi:hypothetical protein